MDYNKQLYFITSDRIDELKRIIEKLEVDASTSQIVKSYLKITNETLAMNIYINEKLKRILK